MERITDHVDQALGRLPQHLDGATEERAILKVFAARWQRLEDALFDLFARFWLDVATGALLTLWGALLREPRDGLGDDDYRRILRAVLLARTSDGTPDRLMQIAGLAAGAVHVRAFELHPATLRIEYGVVATLSDDAARRVVRLLRRAKLPVTLQVVEWIPGPFGFEDAPDGVLGFGAGALARRVDVL